MGSEDAVPVSRCKTISVLKKSFGALCAPGGRYLTVDNIHQVLQPFGLTEDGDIIDLIRQAHLTENGHICYEEFDKILQKRLAALDEPVDECVRNAFYLLDYDKNGYITIPELFHLFGEVGEMWSDQDLYEVVKAGDIDGDGRLDLEDFFKFLGYNLTPREEGEKETELTGSRWPPTLEKIQLTQEVLDTEQTLSPGERPVSSHRRKSGQFSDAGSILAVVREAEDAGLLQYTGRQSRGMRPLSRLATEEELPQLLLRSSPSNFSRRQRSNSLVPSEISQPTALKVRPRSSSMLLRSSSFAALPRRRSTDRRSSLQGSSLSSLLLVRKLEGELKQNGKDSVQVNHPSPPPVSRQGSMTESGRRFSTESDIVEESCKDSGSTADSTKEKQISFHKQDGLSNDQYDNLNLKIGVQPQKCNSETEPTSGASRLGDFSTTNRDTNDTVETFEQKSEPIAATVFSEYGSDKEVKTALPDNNCSSSSCHESVPGETTTEDSVPSVETKHEQNLNEAVQCFSITDIGEAKDKIPETWWKSTDSTVASEAEDSVDGGATADRWENHDLNNISAVISEKTSSENEPSSHGSPSTHDERDSASSLMSYDTTGSLNTTSELSKGRVRSRQGKIFEVKLDISQFAKHVEETLQEKLMTDSTNTTRKTKDPVDRLMRLYNKFDQGTISPPDEPDKHGKFLPERHDGRTSHSTPDSGFGEQTLGNLMRNIDEQLTPRISLPAGSGRLDRKQCTVTPVKQETKTETQSMTQRKLGVLPYRGSPTSVSIYNHPKRLYRQASQGRCLGMGFVLNGQNVTGAFKECRNQNRYGMACSRQAGARDSLPSGKGSLPNKQQVPEKKTDAQSALACKQINLTLAHSGSGNALLRHQSLSRSLAEGRGYMTDRNLRNRSLTRQPRISRRSVIQLQLPDHVTGKEAPKRPSLLSSLPNRHGQFYYR